jgi:hypothetical protein
MSLMAIHGRVDEPNEGKFRHPQNSKACNLGFKQITIRLKINFRLLQTAHRTANNPRFQ